MTIVPLEAVPLRLPRARVVTALGPAFVAAIAYVDPGNVATNVSAGSRFGYLLCWVVVAASAMAVLVQYLSAKLGLATGRTLPEHCRERFSRPAALGLWLQAEGVAVATDLAEVLGGALALQLLFDIPLALGALLTVAGSLLVLMLQGERRQRRYEAVVVAMLAVCGIGFVGSAVSAGPSAAGLARGMVPQFDGSESMLLAAGILGATVMPHAIYVHSALVRDRFGIRGTADSPEEVTARRGLLRATRLDVTTALTLAAGVNLSLIVVAAAALHGRGIDTIPGAHAAIGEVLGPTVALIFAVGLLASGVASTSVGTYAGAVVLEGFAGRCLSPVARRLLTVVPAVALVLSGLDATRALVLSQVILSFGVPFALWPLVRITADRSVMGEFVNRTALTVAAVAVAALITALNGGLLVLLAA